jgi:hypothetical protein
MGMRVDGDMLGIRVPGQDLSAAGIILHRRLKVDFLDIDQLLGKSHGARS